MIVIVAKTFDKDISKLKNDVLNNNVADLLEFIQQIETLTEIPNYKKMKGHKTAYRIKLNSYRLGFYFEQETLIFARILHRKDIYKFFP